MRIATDCHEIAPNKVCPFLSLTEEQQQDKGGDHMCNYSSSKLYHRGKHPILPPLSGCPFATKYTSEELIRALGYYRGVLRKEIEEDEHRIN